MILYEFLNAEPLPSQADLDDINALLPQLTPYAKRIPSSEALARVASNSTLLVARDTDASREGKGGIIGMESLVPLVIPTGFSGRLEDLVVDQGYRGVEHRIGQELEKRLLEKARALGMKHLDLTCNPSRVAGTKLHLALDFTPIETTAYRLKL